MPSNPVRPASAGSSAAFEAIAAACATAVISSGKPLGEVHELARPASSKATGTEQKDTDLGQPRPNALFEHYKQKRYRVLEVATHSESEEELVIYQALYGERKIWARPLAMFTGTVEVDGGKSRPRFEYVGMAEDVAEEKELVRVPVPVTNGDQEEVWQASIVARLSC